MRLLSPAALVIAVTVLASSASAISEVPAPLIQNGSFEHGVSITDFIRLETGSDAIDNWTVMGTEIDYIGNSWPATDGVRSVDLAGLLPGGVFQSFDTVIGQQYSVSFDLAGNPEGTQNEKHLLASADAEEFSFFFDTTGRSTSDMGWIREAFTFTATGTSTLLSFESVTLDSQGAAIDNVVVLPVAAVPEPSTMMMLGMGLSGLAAFGRRRA